MEKIIRKIANCGGSEMKYYIPDTPIRFKLGDVVEMYDGTIGTITRIEDTVLDIRGYYCLYLNGEDVYERSSLVKRWYRKNRKGILVPFCDDKLEYKIYQEMHKDDPPDPMLELVKKSLEKNFKKVFANKDFKPGTAVKLAKFELRTEFYRGYKKKN